MMPRVVSATALVAALTLISLGSANAQPPAKGWKSSITDPTAPTAATVHITKSSSAQVKVSANTVTFILKLKGVLDATDMPVTSTGNTVEFVMLVNGSTHTKGFSFALAGGKTDNSLTKFAVTLSDAGTWGSVLSPGDPIEIRQVRVIEQGTGEIFGVDGITTK